MATRTYTRLSSRQVVNAVADQQVNEVVCGRGVTGILIRNTSGSPQNMWVGFNEDASSKIIVEPGESIRMAKDEGPDYEGNIIRIVFAATDSDNRGYVVLETRTTENC